MIWMKRCKDTPFYVEIDCEYLDPSLWLIYFFNHIDRDIVPIFRESSTKKSTSHSHFNSILCNPVKARLGKWISGIDLYSLRKDILNSNSFSCFLACDRSNWWTPSSMKLKADQSNLASEQLSLSSILSQLHQDWASSSKSILCQFFSRAQTGSLRTHWETE